MMMIFGINLSSMIYFGGKCSVLFLGTMNLSKCLTLEGVFTFGYTSQVLWAACFAHAFYKIVHDLSALPRMLKYYLLIAVGIPLITGISSVFADFVEFSAADRTCNTVFKIKTLNWHLLLYYSLPSLFSVVFSIIFYALATCRLKKMNLAEGFKEIFSLVMLFPGILIILWGPMLLVQQLEVWGVEINQDITKWLRFISYLLGFFNAVVYGEGAKGKILEITHSISKCFCWCGCCDNLCMPKIEETRVQTISQTEEFYHLWESNKARVEFSGSLTESRQSQISHSSGLRKTVKSSPGIIRQIEESV